MNYYEKYLKKRRKEKTKALVVMNESHSLLPEQEEILKREYNDIDFLSVPASGWTLKEMKKIIKQIKNKEYNGEKKYLDVIFVSPIPYMIMELTRKEVDLSGAGEYWDYTGIHVRIFHNDNREKKELPNGKIIQVVAREGWQLV